MLEFNKSLSELKSKVDKLGNFSKLTEDISKGVKELNKQLINNKILSIYDNISNNIFNIEYEDIRDILVQKDMYEFLNIVEYDFGLFLKVLSVIKKYDLESYNKFVSDLYLYPRFGHILGIISSSDSINEGEIKSLTNLNLDKLGDLKFLSLSELEELKKSTSEEEYDFEKNKNIIRIREFILNEKEAI